jgi:hypothetical protein
MAPFVVFPEFFIADKDLDGQTSGAKAREFIDVGGRG